MESRHEHAYPDQRCDRSGGDVSGSFHRSLQRRETPDATARAVTEVHVLLELLVTWRGSGISPTRVPAAHPPSTTSPPERRPLLTQLWVWVVIGLLAGVAVGLLAPKFGQQLQPLSTLGLAPLGAFGALPYTVGKYNSAVLANLAMLVVWFSVTALLVIVVLFGAWPTNAPTTSPSTRSTRPPARSAPDASSPGPDPRCASCSRRAHPPSRAVPPGPPFPKGPNRDRPNTRPRRRGPAHLLDVRPGRRRSRRAAPRAGPRLRPPGRRGPA